LNKAEIFVAGKVQTPESIAIRGDELFTGTGDGAITKIDKDGNVEKIVGLGPPNCVQSVKVQCSRPLGVRFTNQGKLLVADAYNGIFEVDVDAREFLQYKNNPVLELLTRYHCSDNKWKMRLDCSILGTSKLLLAVGTPLSDGIPLNFPDDLDIDKEGIIYFSDMSKYSNMHNMGMEALGEPSGRLVQFNPKTNETLVLIDGLHLANGVQLSRKEDFVLVSETIAERIIRYISGQEHEKRRMIRE